MTVLGIMGAGILLAQPVSAFNFSEDHQYFGKSGAMHHHFENLTEEQREGLKERHAEHRGRRLNEKAEFFNMSPEELETRLQNGETFHDIIEDQGKTRENMQEFMQQMREKHLDELVNEGTISPEKAENLMEKIGSFFGRMLGK